MSNQAIQHVPWLTKMLDNRPVKQIEMMRLYKRTPKYEKIDSQYGILPCYQWLIREKERLESHGRIVKIIDKNGVCALDVNRVAGSLDEEDNRGNWKQRGK